MEEMMNTMGGNAAMGGIGSMAPPEQAAALAAFQNTDKGTLVRDLNSAVNDVAPGAVQSIVAELRTMGFDAEDVNNWIEILDEMVQDPAEYVTSRQQLIQQGMDPEFLPEMYDYEYLIGLRMAFEALRDEVAMMPAMPVQNFAEGGIAELRPIAQAMSQMGRNGDTMLAHITPQEAAMLKRMGGSGTINPYTGLPEFFIKKAFKSVGKAVKSVGKAVGSAVKSVGNAVKSFVKSDIGRIVATIGLTMLAGPAASALLGATAPAWAVTALAAGMGGAGVTLLGGGNLKDALKSGLTSAVVAGVTSGVVQGFDATYAGPTTYGELFGTTPSSAAGTGGPYDIQDSPFSNFDTSATPGAPMTPADVSATQNVLTPTSVSATAPVDYSLAGGAPTQGLSTQGFVDPMYRPDLAAAQGAPVSYNVATGVGGTSLDSGIKFGGTTGLRPAADFAYGPDLSSVSGMAPASAGFDPRLAAGNIGEGVGTVTDTGFTGVQGPSFYDQAKGTLARGYEGAKDIYSEYISPSRGMPTSADISARAGEIIKEAQGMGSSISYKDAMDLAGKELASQAPGAIARYAPIAGIGMGAAYLGGAFTPEAPPEPQLVKGPTGIDLYQANPEQYRPNIYAGQTPVTYQSLNPSYYGQQQYAAYNPFFYAPQSRQMFRGGNQPVYRKNGGITETSKFKRKIGAINGPGTEKSDDIPAMLSDGEFVFTARAVRGMGNGSRRKGAKAMYRLMKMLEKKVKGRR